MSVNNKVRKIVVNFSADFSGISDLRLVDDCLKMTAYDPSCAIRLKTSKKFANRGFAKKFGNNSAFR